MAMDLVPIDFLWPNVLCINSFRILSLRLVVPATELFLSRTPLAVAVVPAAPPLVRPASSPRATESRLRLRLRCVVRAREHENPAQCKHLQLTMRAATKRLILTQARSSAHPNLSRGIGMRQSGVHFIHDPAYTAEDLHERCEPKSQQHEQHLSESE